MNKELIQKLLRKSCWDRQAEVDIEDFISVEKFAQLIVAECVGLCQYESEDDDDQFDLGMMFKAKEISYRIKKHFGE